MKAIRIHEFGQSEDVLKYEDVSGAGTQGR